MRLKNISAIICHDSKLHCALRITHYALLLRGDFMIMTGAKAIVECLRERGVDIIFGYPGGMILPLYDALIDEREIRQILVTHEQNAAQIKSSVGRNGGESARRPSEHARLKK